MLQRLRTSLASGRLRHAGIAIILASLAAAITLFRPVDITFWSIQTKLFAHDPSGDIVFVTDQSSGPTLPAAGMNRQMSAALQRADALGAERIVIDTPLKRSGAAEIDTELRSTLEKLGDKVFLTRTVLPASEQGGATLQSDRMFERGVQIASTDFDPDFLRFVWEFQAYHSDENARYPALWNLLAHDGDATTPIYPDYTIDASDIPTIDVADLAQGKDTVAGGLAGRTIVIGGLGNDPPIVRRPGEGEVAVSLTHIIGAETAMRGAGQLLTADYTIVAFGVALLLGLAFTRSDRARRRYYAAWVASFFIVFVATAKLGIRIELTAPLAVGAIYAFLRASANFRRRHLYVEQRSKLPNFVALQRDLEENKDVRSQAVVVAKIARLDAVFATLSQAEQARYLRQLASRLALGDNEATIYYDGGKYFALILDIADYHDLSGHLEGLRAVASQAITLGKRDIDVSMTIGADQSREASVASRLSSAIAAADQAREAYRPVFIISDFEADSEAWDYSLQSRLESALSEDRISIKLQPQADLASGLIIGAEALARWVDEERGEIPPAQFILQCERVGRLDDLTKRILLKSLHASRSLDLEGLPARVSVNVSAIQFVDHRIADLIENAIEQTRADPKQILIEITESARIEDMVVAREIMERLRQTGLRFSIDDFGVASANLHALYSLPFSEIKIDRMFVRDITKSALARSIVTNMVRLAKDADLISVAEGIEDREVFNELRELGCDVAQGFYLARPQTIPQYTETLSLQEDSVIRRQVHN